MGHARSKTRSEGQIIEKPLNTLEVSFGPGLIEIGQDLIWIIPGQELGQ